MALRVRHCQERDAEFALDGPGLEGSGDEPDGDLPRAVGELANLPLALLLLPGCLVLVLALALALTLVLVLVLVAVAAGVQAASALKEEAAACEVAATLRMQPRHTVPPTAWNVLQVQYYKTRLD